MKFNKLFDHKKPPKTIAGERYKIEYKLELDEHGVEHLVKCGKTDMHEYIQSHADSVDLNLMIQRYTMGDTDALERMQGFYADVSGMPVSMAEMLNVHNKGKMLFETLPQEIREAYGNNYVTFLSNPKLYEDMKAQRLKENVADKKTEEKEVTADEQEH